MFFSCTNSSEEVKDFFADKNLPMGYAENVAHVYKDSGRVSSKMQTPILLDFSNRKMNPYNEFPTRDVRASLIGKFQNDLARLKDPSGRRSFFDPQTSGFINEGLNRLRTCEYSLYSEKKSYSSTYKDSKEETNNAQQISMLSELRSNFGAEIIKDKNISTNDNLIQALISQY